MAATAKKIESVPTPADDLQTAVRNLERERAQLAKLNEEMARLSRFREEHAAAQAALDALARADTAQLSAWAASGARGAAPAMDEAARKQVTERLAIASREWHGAQAALHAIEEKYVAQVQVVDDADMAVKATAANVRGLELQQTFTRYRALVDESVMLEIEMAAAKSRLFDLGIPVADVHGDALAKRFLEQFTAEEQRERQQRAQAREADRWQQLLRGEV